MKKKALDRRCVGSSWRCASLSLTQGMVLLIWPSVLQVVTNLWGKVWELISKGVVSSLRPFPSKGLRVSQSLPAFSR